MTTIPVALGERSYEVRIEEGALERAADHLAPFARDGRLVVVTDENVWAAQGERLRRGLGAIQAVPIVLPPGEGSKSWATLAGLIDRLLEARLERSDHLVAFGGGVIGDLAGFAAAILNRGIAFVQIPTSLLAQVDSSVGGKTGINVPAGKNLVGAFHQPSLVLIDPLVLDTLDPRQIRAGYAEIVKYALIEDAPFFDWLDANGSALLAGDAEARRHAIATSVAGKAGIVARDERETAGVRALLNLGHTFGHALEAEAGFSDRLLHGEAVAAGMALAFAFSAERGLCKDADAERVRAHLATVGLPTGLREAGISATGQRLADHMMLDKKKEGGRIPFILARGIGQAFVDREVALADVAAFLDRQG
ncbi:3-dehydroquinate synthase [Sphingomonas sp. LY54]|uniref:3-dehydroquinate synthase n=1 Tax=Sphingomonas sp. LY54 TaxID=3095343 RepID=UPI002D76B44C|nr:3-dehydroquinate synthase [Sphingomonas sp. LY54]WRP27935.1 3-dehydroquinate synthase [Sphingomonas sp. LY54]